MTQINDPATASDILLLAESNHRISNNLMLVAAAVRMKAARIARHEEPLAPAEVQRELIEVATRIESVGTLHRLLSDVPRFGAVELGRYLREMCERVARSLGRNDWLDLSGIGDDCEVTAADALPIAFIVQELVTNAFKYAHPAGVAGRIFVACRRDFDGALTVTVADDGVGLPEGFDARSGGDHGFRVVRSLADQLGASIAFESSDLGLTCIIRVPPKPI